MKKYLLVIILMILPLSMMAKPYFQKEMTAKKIPSLNVNEQFTSSKNAEMLKSNKIQATGFAIIDTLQDAYWYNDQQCTPMAYDPASNTIFMVKAYRESIEEGDPMSGWVVMKYSTDNGANWTYKTMYPVTEGMVPVWPSIAVNNPSGSKLPMDCDIVVVSKLAKHQASDDSYPWAGSLYNVYTAGEVTSFEVSGPNNKGSYQWSLSKMSSYSNSAKSLFAAPGMLQPKVSTTQYGLYGIAIYDATAGDFVEATQSPAQWGLDKYKASDVVNSSYNSPMYSDFDNSGNLYVCVNNSFVANDPTNTPRTPGISKSTDFGKTWSDFDICPLSVIENYITSQGGLLKTNGLYIPSLLPYQHDGFIVTGNDEYHIAFRLWFSTEEDGYNSFHIVEAVKKGGVWKMNKIADYTGYLYLNESGYIGLQTVADKAEENATVCFDSLDINSLGSCVQLSKTADGQHLIVKFVDYTENLQIFDPEATISGGEMIDSMFTSDIYLAYKGVNEDNWSVPVNVTKDDTFDKTVWMPQVVKDVHTVPVYRTVSAVWSTTSDYWLPRNDYPEMLQNMTTNIRQFIEFKVIDPTIDAVKEQTEQFDFTLFAPKPNPVSDYTEISFNLDRTSNISLCVFNSLGQKVKTLKEGTLTNGTYAVTLNTNDLTSGMYYITLSNGDKSVTKALSVVK